MKDSIRIRNSASRPRLTSPDHSRKENWLPGTGPHTTTFFPGNEGMKRVDSYTRKYSDDEASYNKNVQWMSDPFAWVFYPLAIGGTFGFTMALTSSTVPEAIAATNAIHGLATFILLHWIKGSPDFFDSGTYNHLTMWEQIEPGEPWTVTKKFLMLVPTLLLFITLVTSGYDQKVMIINIPIWFVTVVAKFPFMERVRLFGINSTLGVDDEVDSSKKN